MRQQNTKAEGKGKNYKKIPTPISPPKPYYKSTTHTPPPPPILSPIIFYNNTMDMSFLVQMR